MSGNGDNDITVNIDRNGNVAFKRFDKQCYNSTHSTASANGSSSDDEFDSNQATSNSQLKKQKLFNTDRRANAQADQKSVMTAKENFGAIFDDERPKASSKHFPSIPADKLHRRNPSTVRQELKMFEDFVPDTTLADVQLNEMPGLQNTEQWKRIAGRIVQSSTPLSSHHYETVESSVPLQNGQVPQQLGSYRRPGRSEDEVDDQNIVTSRWGPVNRRVLFGSSIAVVIVTVVVSVVIAVTLIKKTDLNATDYYSGTVSVRANFDPLLWNTSSSLARDYKKEFCSLIRRTLVDGKTKYAKEYSTCSVTSFHNGSITADFILGFTSDQDVTDLSLLLNNTLVNQRLFGGTVLSIELNTTELNDNNTSSQPIDDADSGSNDNGNDDEDDDDDKSNKLRRLIMSEQNIAVNEQEQPTQTSYTTVTYKTLEKGLSITISETITITNNSNFDKLPINNKNYELILVPTNESTKAIVVPSSNTNEKALVPPTTTTATAAAATTTTQLTKSPSIPHLLRPIKTINDTHFAYIDESADDHTISSGHATSTLEDVTTRDSSTSASTTSLDDGTLTNSASTAEKTTSNGRTHQTRIIKSKRENRDDNRFLSLRSYPNAIKRQQRRIVVPKNHRRLLQYELMPTGKIYYVDRQFYNENKLSKDDNESNSSAVLSTILSRSSSVDTLSDKRFRRRHHNHHHHHYHNHHNHHPQIQQQQQQQQQQLLLQQSYQQRKMTPNSLLQKPEQKISIGGRLASANNLTATTATTTSTTSPFKPINLKKTKRFSSFEPTPESLDQVLDVLVAADKRREEHEFWKERFDPRLTTSRPTLFGSRTLDTTHTNTVPYLRAKQTYLNVNSSLNSNENRSQSFINKRNSSYESYHQQSGSLLDDCLRRRNLIAQQQQQQQQQKAHLFQPERNYSPNTIYSTNYPKQQVLTTGKPPLPTTATAAAAATATATTTATTITTTNTANPQPVRILPTSNGRLGRAPQARQTSDELSSVSDIWATRSSVEDESNRPKKPILQNRFQSVVNRNRANDQKVVNNKRASSVGQQQKSNRTQTKVSTAPTATKNKFFDLFKFTR